ncbi:MAG: 1,2-phenylacetyl-CoA epoxidase subunit PaaD [Ginsengibacter sp.]
MTIDTQISKQVLEEELFQLLEDVYDPEIPVLSIIDLGIVKNVEVSINNDKSKTATLTITPTYSGCPAMDVIAFSIRTTLVQHGYQVVIKQQLSPAWTTDWMTPAGKDKLKAYGIAPPQLNHKRLDKLFEESEPVICPRCNSTNTNIISEFGSTACKALHRCLDCKEPFDHFKCH